MATEPDEKHRSYTIRETVPPGRFVALDRDVYSNGPLPAGTVIQVTSYTNAGFAGITLSGLVYVAGQICQYVCSIPAGAVSEVRDA